MRLLLLFLPLSLVAACAPNEPDDEEEEEVAAAELKSPYALGWPVDACSVDFPEAGTGLSEGDVLPQYELIAQTEEWVKLHNFCNHVVFVEFGYFT